MSTATAGVIDEVAEAEVRQEQVQEQATDLVRQARELEIGGDEDYQDAAAFLVSVKAVRREIADVFDPIISSAHAAHKEALAQRRKVEAPAIEAERVVKGAIADFDRRQEQERRRLEAEARERSKREAEDRQVERAARLENEGKAQEAEAMLERPPLAEAPMPAPPKPKAEGVSVRKSWDYRVVDIDSVARKFMELDKKKVGQIVRSMGPDAADLVGGIEVYEKRSVAARAGSSS